MSSTRIKSILEPHYRIPQPILSILVGNLPQVSSAIEDVTDETPREDGWNNVFRDEVDELTPSRSPSPVDKHKNHKDILMAASADGRSLVLAYQTKFVMVQLNREGEYMALGQGSGCQSPNQHYVMCGYSTGWIRVFSEMRTPPPVFRAHQSAHQDEDITILFRGNRVVSVDGQSLWMALRVCDGQRESGIDASRMHTAFTYKKWELKQEEVKDIISLGPSPPGTETFLPPHATCRYMAVGARPMLTYYATSESTRPSAASMASYMVSRVASPVFSLAKSWWTGEEKRDTRPIPIEIATPIPAVLSMEDQRKIQSIVVSPATTSSQHHPLAVTSDALGRVILWDVNQGEMIRLWKGVRDAVCGWVEVVEHELYQRKPDPIPRVLLFLVIYTSRRGILKVFQMRHGQQVGAYHVGSDWHLVPCGQEPLGSSMVSVDRRYRSTGKDDGLASCLLIGPDGEVRRIKIILRNNKLSLQ
ncbi:Rab3 GTPase-activating protein regulatory subunit N-terminus-domain-containing protein [Choanephora cucurbitarum]|nr:Rab3 GTPase-activating protein regulatory subunit N-terminus-domain-containing protein [Choanephora cucurbitarum]